MNLKAIANMMLERIRIRPYQLIDRLYVPLDQKHVRRTRNIRHIPRENSRRGGKYSYAEWAHVIGIFQTLIFLHLKDKENNRIVDVGCGTGLMGIASDPFIGPNGKYVGIDVMKKDIDFCRRHYSSQHHEFFHLDINNPSYSPNQKNKKLNWPLDGDSFDLVTALSVWTHLNEEDATFYFREIKRVLKPGGKAIVTFFLLDEIYEKSLSIRSMRQGRYHMTGQNKWVFDQSAYGSDAWFHPEWVSFPENAIGVTRAGLDRLLSNSGLAFVEHCQGNWKEVPGAFFQDVLIFQKS